MSSKTGPIIIIEDDEDDEELIRDAFVYLKISNELKFFRSCMDALDYLFTTTDKPMIIISDINLPGMTGIEMRQKINENDYLRKKSIPFVFLTTSGNKENVINAYDMMVQGYFIKPTTINELRDSIKMVIDYWKTCLHPNSF
ncbi:MAG: response regulator [Candidatus Dadabacteria bacterium]